MPQFIVEKYLPGFAKSPPIFIKIEDLWKTDVKCVFTGATDDSDPQGNRSLLPFGYRPYDSESDPKFTSDGNVLPMRDDVYELWLGNVFSVDVDDDYRIRIFDRAAADMGLPDKLVNSDKRWDIFFREHMRYTITVRFFGGELGIEQKKPEVLELMAETGEFSGEKWNTVLGQEIMLGKLAEGLGKGSTNSGGNDDTEAGEIQNTEGNLSSSS
ncbi:hypothetical protein TRAPUB_2592 [Trametes pubescens]|uniref:Uncharacterized protein n=1 Tax=Trametes pubescens TaxID=154538 RepID=A0A1M2VFZ7_TRAPU|nr:hypothetical protein TRAPUB_2592 [Trametes pubescens]